MPEAARPVCSLSTSAAKWAMVSLCAVTVWLVCSRRALMVCNEV